MTFDDLEFEPHHSGRGYHAILELPNNYGVSVIYGHPGYYCNEGTYEVAILYKSDLCYSTPITNDVLSYQTKEDINKILKQLESYD